MATDSPPELHDRSVCRDGDWEEDLGVTMETLNNPGWRLDVRRA
jgi:hypothetical protein